MRPAQTALVWLDVRWIDVREHPSRDQPHHRHCRRRTVTAADPADHERNIAPTTVDNRKPAGIRRRWPAPNWLDGNGCCDMNAHRMALNPINGRLWAAERYAIDYVRLTPDGTNVQRRQDQGARAIPTSAPRCTPSPTGRWWRSSTTWPNRFPARPPAGLPLDQYAGNRVMQDIGGGNYVMYAHLKTGSVKVKAGDRLTTGQVIAAVGNTGNTDAPHLHFQLMSTPDPLRSNGLPFLIRQSSGWIRG